MRISRPTALLASVFTATIAAMAQPVDTTAADLSWDPARMGRWIAAARQSRQEGELMAAERLCRDAFESVEQSALAAYDAYAARLEVEHRNEAGTVRERSARLHALKAERSRGSQPTSTYLGFAPSDDLTAYADLLSSLHEADASQRMRSLALAYQQVQQAHFQRTMMFRQGKDPRGSC